MELISRTMSNFDNKMQEKEKELVSFLRQVTSIEYTVKF